MTKAGEPHMAAAKKVLRYLQSRKKIPLKWCAVDNALPGVIHGYADASFADIPDTRLSSIGYVFLVNGGAISWRSTKTPLQVLNAAEAEIVSLSSAAQECLFLRKLCIEMGFHQHRPTIIYEDCEAAVALSKETRFRKRSTHCPSLALYSRTSRPSGLRPQGHPPTSQKDACGHIRITSCRTNLHRVSRSHSRTPVRVRC